MNVLLKPKMAARREKWFLILICTERGSFQSCSTHSWNVAPLHPLSPCCSVPTNPFWFTCPLLQSRSILKMKPFYEISNNNDNWSSEILACTLCSVIKMSWRTGDVERECHDLTITCFSKLVTLIALLRRCCRHCIQCICIKSH